MAIIVPPAARRRILNAAKSNHHQAGRDMITRVVYTRNKGTGNQVWVFLRYNPTDNIYRIHAGYCHCRPETQDWYSEEREYRLHEYLQEHPEWEAKIRQLQEEIESAHLQHPGTRLT